VKIFLVKNPGYTAEFNDIISAQNMVVSSKNQVRLETASVACCGTPAGSVSIEVDVLRCRRDVNTPTHEHAMHIHYIYQQPITASYK